MKGAIKMTEFETFKALLDRIGDKYEITEWAAIKEAWIEDYSTGVIFEFIDGKLACITNVKE